MEEIKNIVSIGGYTIANSHGGKVRISDADGLSVYVNTDKVELFLADLLDETIHNGK